ncbi:MAG: transcription-repair coupling factor, partial [Verrucomicrobia bacterium]
MEKPIGAELLERVAACEPIAHKLDAIAKAAWPVKFSHVIEPAQPFLAAVIAHSFGRTRDLQHSTKSTIWILCPSVHSQELFYESLLNWQPEALFLPEAELAAVENVLPDPEIAAERLALLTEIERDSRPRIVVATRASLDQSAPKRGTLQSAVTQLTRGAAAKMEQLVEQLVGNGYERGAQVTTRGQFAVRGGIVDIYSWQQIESLREFDIDSQTSVRDLRLADLLLGTADDQSGLVRDYVAPDHLILDIEPEEISDAQIQISENWIDTGPEDFSGAFQDCDIGEFAAGDLVLAEAKRAQFVERLKEWRTNNASIVIYFQTEGEIERFREIMAGALDGLDFVEGTLARGFCFPAANLVVLSAAELFGRFAVHARRRLRRAERHRAQIDFGELNEGDLVVHLEHGIGKFLGLQKIPVGQTPRLPDGPSLASGALTLQQQTQPQEVLVLEFADEARLYVPLEQAYLVSRYVGAGKRSPPLSSLGDGKWARAKIKAAASIFDYAGKMLAIQAERQMHAGNAFAPDTKWQAEFERSFPFRETPDQMKAIIDTKIDMERPRPMDRLICGDVGFGKTEVAVRAAFKAVMDGRQVAVLAPTTVLAQQHFEVFRQRMLDYPVRIEMLSRFRSQSEQKKVLQMLREGGVDIIIGTHRLISGDVVFKDL